MTGGDPSDLEIPAAMAGQPAGLWLELCAAADLLDAGEPGAVDRDHPVGDGMMSLPQHVYSPGVASVYRLSTERAGVMMRTDAYAGFAWHGPATDAWLGGVLASDAGMNKLKKLARAADAERHLVIVLRAFSKAGPWYPAGFGIAP